MNVCILKIIERSFFHYKDAYVQSKGSTEFKRWRHENLTFSMFKCYNRVPVHLPTQKTLKRTTHFFQTFIFSKPFSAGLWKNEPLRFLSHCDVEKGSYNITAPWSACFHPRRKWQWCTSPVLMPWGKFKQSMQTVLSWICWFIYCILRCCHRSNINMQFIFQPFQP